MKKIKTTKVNIIDRLIIIFLPILFGLIVRAITECIVRKSNYQIVVAEGMELIKSIIDVWGILLGFVITAVSILLTIGDNSFITTLVETNHMKSIILSYVTSSVYLLLSIVFSIALLVAKAWNSEMFSAFLGINACIVVSIAICIYFLFAIALKIHG